MAKKNLCQPTSWQEITEVGEAASLSEHKFRAHKHKHVIASIGTLVIPMTMSLTLEIIVVFDYTNRSSVPNNTKPPITKFTLKKERKKLTLINDPFDPGLLPMIAVMQPQLHKLDLLEVGFSVAGSAERGKGTEQLTIPPLKFKHAVTGM